MGKRSDFARRPQDAYDTPYGPVSVLAPHLAGIELFAEPCVGNGELANHLTSFGLKCVYANDIKNGVDALHTNYFGLVDAIITNPPWTRAVLHPMIRHFQRIAPTWLLFDADWAHTNQAAPYLPQCSHIVSVGRVRWIPGSKHDGKDNAAWYRFHAQHVDGPRFIGQPVSEAA